MIDNFASDHDVACVAGYGVVNLLCLPQHRQIHLRKHAKSSLATNGVFPGFGSVCHISLILVLSNLVVGFFSTICTAASHHMATELVGILIRR